ncbi:hypothetical protein FA13DRAFT_1727679 [Coprinellus micaceus]|uniref:Uncharacterized protein n=1 Tax=Coprinellus micaceus TaxID=71717 RepID=A0A4Y7TQB2_COPMI|nr:hypothetical protein FA13DRAFT_1727679 [Coprinellus micaceus]
MSSTFTPSTIVDHSKEKEWQSALGMLDWDNTSIVFTKRTLIEFLKYTGTTVDTNLNNIAKLPRYAKFGKISEPVQGAGASAEAPADGVQASISTSSDGLKPTRRVREPPGGAHSNIFGGCDDEDDALARAPPKPQGQYDEPVRAQPQPQEEEEPQGLALPSTMKPSRRVREGPGGKDSLHNFWGTEEEEPAFKPTRRVREGPGGRDNVSGIF